MRGWSPPFELKWLTIANTCVPWNMNSPASGLRLELHAPFAGSMRPGLKVSCVEPPVPVIAVGSVDVPPGRSTDPTAVGPEEEDLADVAAGLAAVLVVDRVD